MYQTAICAPKLANFCINLLRVGLAQYTVGACHSAISAFLELHHHKASNHPVFSKLMCKSYLQCPSSHKHVDLWDNKHSLSFLQNWAPVSSLNNFKIAWKNTTLLKLVIEKCSYLTLLHIDNQHLFSSASCYYFYSDICL